MFSGQGSSFRRVGLVEFPSPGMWSIVLISQAPSVEIANNLPGEEEHISVFLPCAPNPTTGFFFYVPKSKIIEVEMSTEDAATLIMSCGVVQPGSDGQKKIAALAGMANAARVANAASLQPEAGEGGVTCISGHLRPGPSVILEAKRRSNPSFLRGELDCFASLAMTVSGSPRPNQRDRLIALEQIEQAAQRLAARRPSVWDCPS